MPAHDLDDGHEPVAIPQIVDQPTREVAMAELRAREKAATREIVRIGHALGLETVAEGVEHEHQLIALRRMGCELGQGFHLARPLPIDELTTFLARAGRSSPPAVA